MQEVIEICRKHGLSYFLIEGSLLGAVRHGGFIPWDDDMDIAMPSGDHARFVEAARAELPDFLYMEAAYEEQPGGGSDCLTRIYNRNVTIQVEGEQSHPWIDVMMLEGMPASIIKQHLHFGHVLACRALIKMSNPALIGENAANENARDQLLIWLARRLPLHRLLNTQARYRALRRCLDRYPYGASPFAFAHPTWYRFKEVVPRVVYGQGKEAAFEGIRANLPEDAGALLEKIYGDYMTLPPPEERVGKHTQQSEEEA